MKDLELLLTTRDRVLGQTDGAAAGRGVGSGAGAAEEQVYLKVI